MSSSNVAAKAVKPALYLCASVMAFTAAAASAQTAEPTSGGALEEILVTAQRRTENLQVVPISVTAVTADTLASSGITGLTDISQIVPSVQLTRSGPSAQFFVRGVGNANGSTGEEGANAFYLDGVYLGDLGQVTMEFNNIERVEVLKGPQGTLFGRNASGGLVHIITRDPGQELEVKGKVGYGNYDTWTGQLYVAGPISDTVSADLAFSGKKQNSGYGKNLATGEDVGLGRFYAFRSKWVWRPGVDTTVKVTADYRNNEEDYAQSFTLFRGSIGPGGYGYVGDYDVNTVDHGYLTLENYGASLTAEHDFGPITLTSITGYRKLTSISALDGDYTPVRSTRITVDSGNETIQQELRLASNNSGPFNWQLGGFYYRGQADLFGQTVLGTAVGGIDSGYVGQSQQKTTSYAAFGEISYDLTETTHLTGGLRYTKDKRDIKARQDVINQTNEVLINALTLAPLEQSVSFSEVTWRAAIRQDLSENVNIYGSYNRGFKSGLFSLQNPAAAAVKPQTIDAFEVGIKSELFDRTVRLNVAAFHYTIEDYQVRSSIGVGASSLLLNAATVKVDGAEVELQLVPTERLRFMANATYLNSRFDEFDGNLNHYPRPATCNPAGTVPPGFTTGTPTGGNVVCRGSAAGNRTPLSPELAASFGFNYSSPVGNEGELIVSGMVNYNSKIFFESDNRLSQNGYALFNGAIEFRPNANWGIELWGKNLFDKRYYYQGVAGAGGDKGDLAAPRTYGVNVKFDF